MALLRLAIWKHVFALLCGLSLASHVHSDGVALVGGAFVDLECWDNALSNTPDRHDPLGSKTTGLETRILENPIRSMELPKVWRPPSKEAGYSGSVGSLAERLMDAMVANHDPMKKFIPCVLTIEQLPTSKRLKAVEASHLELTTRVRHLEDSYQSAADIATDLVKRLTSAQDRMSALEEELARLRTQPSPPAGKKGQ